MSVLYLDPFECFFSVQPNIGLEQKMPIKNDWNSPNKSTSQLTQVDDTTSTYISQKFVFRKYLD